MSQHFLHFKALLSVVAKRETSKVSKASEERICHFPPFYFIKTHLAGTVLDDTRRLMSFEFLFVCGCPLGPCHFILILPPPLPLPQPDRRLFAIRYYHSNHIGTHIESKVHQGFIPILLLVGEQIDQNISLQREMVQECVKRQGAQDRGREKRRKGGGRGVVGWGGYRRRWGGGVGGGGELERC